MRKLALLAAAVIAGLAAYLVVFVLLVEKPLTQNIFADYIARKQQILAATPSPRIVIFAGSNGRFSHSCAVITQVTGIPCANLSITATLGQRYQVDSYLSLLRAGDLVYMPLEYRDEHVYDPTFVGDEHFNLVATDPARVLALYTPRGVLRAFFGFNFRYLISATGEMLLARDGVRQRFGVGTLNARGDEVGHTAARARAFRDIVAAEPVPVANGPAQRSAKYWVDVATQVARLRRHGILVVGGLPTTVADARVSPATIGFLRGVFTRAGACYLVLPGHSLYPRAWFYDSVYHLDEAGQRAHSARLAPYLAAIFRSRRCPR